MTDKTGAAVVRGDQWMIFSSLVATGADTGLTVTSVLPALQIYADDIIIDGISIRTKVAAGGAVRVRASNLANLAVYIDYFTAGAGTDEYRAYYPLLLCHHIADSALVPFVIVEVALAVTDVVSVSAWGHFIPILAAVDVAQTGPQPVSVEEMKVWPWKRV